MEITIQVMKPAYTYEDLDTALHIAEAAIKRGHKVNLFLFSDAVIGANKSIKPIKIDRVIPEKMKELIEKGLRVDLCGICMDYRGLSQGNIIEGANPSGLPELASLVYSSDVFINLMA